MIDILTMPVGEPIYTFVGHDGENIHIAANRLRVWCESAGLEPVLGPMDRSVADTFLADNVVSLDRVAQLEGRLRYDPIIMCKTGTFKDGHPDVVMADGHHRYYVQRDREYFLMYLLEEHQWRPFQISGAPDMTQEWLREVEVVKRDYWKTT